MSASPWLIYALGGGWGHLMRSLALGRRVARDRLVQILVNSPYFARLIELGKAQAIETYGNQPGCTYRVEGCQVTWLPAGDREATVAAIHFYFAQPEYAWWIVDTFPRGLLGELVPWLSTPSPQKRVLVHRDLNPAYVQAKAVEPFVLSHFDLILIPGEASQGVFATAPQARITPPWLIRDASELLSPAAARSHLALPNPGALRLPASLASHPSTIFILAGGSREELEDYGSLAHRVAENFPSCTVVCLAASRPSTCPPELWRCHWPAIEVLPAADLVVGGGGYHTVYECQALDIPLVAIPRSRLYDRQDFRLQVARSHGQRVWLVQSPEAAIESLKQILFLDKSRLNLFKNGTELAIKIMLGLG